MGGGSTGPGESRWSEPGFVTGHHQLAPPREFYLYYDI